MIKSCIKNLKLGDHITLLSVNNKDRAEYIFSHFDYCNSEIDRIWMLEGNITVWTNSFNRITKIKKSQ